VAIEIDHPILSDCSDLAKFPIQCTWTAVCYSSYLKNFMLAIFVRCVLLPDGE
jgi:hypothetical protein